MKSDRLYIFFPLFLLLPNIGNIQKIVEENKGVTVYSSTSTTVNGENVTVKTNQPGSVEVKNTNGKVEIKTSKGITPTIIVTGTQNQLIAVEGKKLIKIEFLKNFWKRFLNFFCKT